MPSHSSMWDREWANEEAKLVIDSDGYKNKKRARCFICHVMALVLLALTKIFLPCVKYQLALCTDEKLNISSFILSIALSVIGVIN